MKGISVIILIHNRKQHFNPSFVVFSNKTFEWDVAKGWFTQENQQRCSTVKYSDYESAAFVHINKFLWLATQIKTVSRPSPPKKLKTSKSEVVKKVEEPEWEQEVEEFEELKRKVIPPKITTKTASPAVSSVKVVKKTSVFDRLGESNVTSTTPEIQDSPTTTPSNATTVAKVKYWYSNIIK